MTHNVAHQKIVFGFAIICYWIVGDFNAKYADPNTLITVKQQFLSLCI